MHLERTLHTPRRRNVALFAGLLLAVGAATAAGAHEGHEAQSAAAADPNFDQIPLAKGAWETGEPMSLEVLPDRSVLHTSRNGTLRLTNAAGITKFAGHLDVYDFKEEGLQGVAAARLLARAHEAGLTGALPGLGFDFKDPDPAASSSLTEQYKALLGFAKRLRAASA